PISARGKGNSQIAARKGGLERHAGFEPVLAALAHARDGFGMRSRRERHATGTLRRGSGEPGKALRDLLELERRGARALALTGGERDLDLRGEKARTRERIRRRARERGLDGRERRARIATRETQQGGSR